MIPYFLLRLQNTGNLKELIDTYCTTSGQRVNTVKSNQYFSSNANEEQKKFVEDFPAICNVSDLGKYMQGYQQHVIGPRQKRSHINC